MPVGRFVTTGRNPGRLVLEQSCGHFPLPRTVVDDENETRIGQRRSAALACSERRIRAVLSGSIPGHWSFESQVLADRSRHPAKAKCEVCLKPSRRP